ncbi:MAG: dihydropteroate synthase, partial [Nitrosopumilaceae archaeon]|nr:dihydropteroate synthase [Nitrosopumilaceae archaeon]
ISVGGSNPVRIMGILNLSPESFYKKSIKTTKNEIISTVKKMEDDGADIIDIGGMSTAPYLKTIISEKQESRRLIDAIKIIQNISNIPISVDTCRSNVAKAVLEYGIDVINDISGLKYDKKMIHVLQQYDPSVILCSYNKIATTGGILETKKFLKQSISLTKTANISENKIVIDPAIGFFRKKGVGKFFSKINSDWALRDLEILHKLKYLRLNFPILISVSRKSFLGYILGENDPEDRISGSLACEVLSVINGADIIRTHNVQESKQVVTIAKKLTRTNKSL